jgi:hypothetical protein
VIYHALWLLKYSEILIFQRTIFVKNLRTHKPPKAREQAFSSIKSPSYMVNEVIKISY